MEEWKCALHAMAAVDGRAAGKAEKYEMKKWTE
jgi:hypothetical protein